MDDAEWLFKTDSREKKNVAQSARKKVRHTGCKLPSDYLSAKEKKQMNGEVFCMNIHKPMNYKYFKTLPKDLQQEYLDWLVTTFGVSQKDICKEMLKVTTTSLIKYIKKVGLKSPFSGNRSMNIPYNRDAWLKFLAGEESAEHAIVYSENHPDGELVDIQKASESCEKARSEMNETVFYAKEARTLDEIVTEQPFEVGSLSFNLKNIRDWDALKECLSAFPLPAYNSVVITVHALREE